MTGSLHLYMQSTHLIWLQRGAFTLGGLAHVSVEVRGLLTVMLAFKG